MRQIRIITKTPSTDQTQLQPGVHGTLYNIPEVRAARVIIAENESIEMLGIRIGARFYSLVVIHADELQEGHFEI